MDALNVIERMAVSPDPTGWYRRQYQRTLLMPMYPVDDPNIVVVRPYGVSKGIGMTTMPQDYTLMHYGGTLRGAKIGQWRKSLLVSTKPQEVNAPNMFTWRSTKSKATVGSQMLLEGMDEMV